MSGKDVKAMKVSDVSLAEFVEFVKKKDPALCEKAVKEGHLDIAKTVKTIKEEVVQNFSILTGVTKAAAEVRVALEMALAKEVPCYYLGMKDRPGSKMPANMALLKLSGEAERKGTRATLFEAKTFDPNLEMPDGSKVHLDGMGKITLKLKENVKFDTFEVVQLTRYEKVEQEKLATLLASVVNDPRKFTADDKYKTIILLGNIRGIYPVNILAKDEDDAWKSVGEYPLLVANELEGEKKEMTPVLKIGLEPIYGVTVRVTFDPRKYTEPYIGVEDMMECVKTAVHDIKSPNEQAAAVGEIMANRDVIIVGSISKVSTNKAGSTFMEVSGFSIIDAPQKFNWFADAPTTAPAETKTEETHEAPAEKAAPPAEPAAPAAGPAASKKKTTHSNKEAEKPASESTASGGAASAPAPVTKFDAVKAAIQEYCTKLNMKPEQLTVEIVKEQICPSAKGGVIETALDEIKSEAGASA
jgi:hypothetical protein